MSFCGGGKMQEYLPYIISVVCALVSGITSYLVARKQAKNDLEIIIKQHEVDLKALERKHQMEIEKINLEHSHQLEIQEKDLESRIGSSMITEVMKMPEIRQQIVRGMKQGRK